MKFILVLLFVAVVHTQTAYASNGVASDPDIFVTTPMEFKYTNSLSYEEINKGRKKRNVPIDMLPEYLKQKYDLLVAAWALNEQCSILDEISTRQLEFYGDRIMSYAQENKIINSEDLLNLQYEYREDAKEAPWAECDELVVDKIKTGVLMTQMIHEVLFTDGEK